jgi:hypothetical protein
VDLLFGQGGGEIDRGGGLADAALLIGDGENSGGHEFFPSKRESGGAASLGADGIGDGLNAKARRGEGRSQGQAAW